MKFYKLIFLSFMTFLLSYPCATLMGSPNGPEMERQISRIIKHMTLEEKIGQMTQLTREYQKGDTLHIDMASRGGCAVSFIPKKNII